MKALLVFLMTTLGGIWPTSEGPELRECPGPEVFAASEGRTVKMPEGCPVHEAGLWRSVEGDATRYAEHRALEAERDRLRVELDIARAQLEACRRTAALHLADCAEGLQLARDDLAEVTTDRCNAWVVGASACALCAGGSAIATWGVTR